MERERRQQQLIGRCAVVEAAGGLGAAPPALAQQTAVIRIERHVLGESGLINGERGIDREAAQQLRVLMRDRTTGRSVTPSAGLIGVLATLAEWFPGRTMSIVRGYADLQEGLNSGSHAEGRALDLRIAEVNCSDIEVSSRSDPGFSHG